MKHTLKVKMNLMNKVINLGGQTVTLTIQFGLESNENSIDDDVGLDHNDDIESSASPDEYI